MKIEAPSPGDGEAIEALLDEAFGAQRHLRTAYRLREGAEPVAGLTLVARDGSRLLGSLQCWPVLLVQPSRRAHALTLVGPVAVAVGARGTGVGTAMLHAMLARAGEAPLLLIGDAPYYGRFGFTADDTSQWMLPGPVERDRLLARGAGGLPRLAEVRRAVVLRNAA